MTDQQTVFLLVLGSFTMLAVLSALLPLRGGHGQHAHAGPGTLTVAHLSDTPTPHRSERNFRPAYASESSVHSPPDVDGEIDWPPEPDEPVPVERDTGTGVAARELRALLHLFPAPESETGYIGRHRLAEPETVETYLPPGDVELTVAA